MTQDIEKDRDEKSIPCLYFKKPGRDNTRKTLATAARRVRELDLRTVLIASTSGETGLMAAELIDVENLVVVSHSTGFIRPDVQQMTPEDREALEKSGARILTVQHAFGGIGRAVRKKLGTYELEELVAFTLRLFGQGMKVAIEIALMAADAGLVSTFEPCVSIGGTNDGADTAVLLKPAHAQNFFDLKVQEILAKPRFWDD